MRTREPMFDIAKLAAILMVVFGHVQTASEMTWGSPYIKNFIIGVNMPLFFAISGFFVRGMSTKGSWRYLIVRIVNLLWPAFFASIFMCVIKAILCANIGVLSVQWLWGKFMSFWFLWVLSACILISFCMDNITLGRKKGGTLWYSHLFCFVVFAK